MGQALYRKYRSKSLSEIVGQEHITTTLANALKSGKINHAYLFTGPRGVGKTSIARILAHEVNNLPYTGEKMHLDIIEIDAASNRGIEEIRELREKVHNMPSGGKYKVYIIDEVHMLTKQAFNALLKTLEEPPAHVIFILATTEGHKIPETIISRTQRYTFKPIEPEKVYSHLKKISNDEGIKVTDEAIRLIARHGEGSFRDSISLLDQVSSNTKAVDEEAVLLMLGIPTQAAINDLLDITLNHEPGRLIEHLNRMWQQGFHGASIAKQLSIKLRELLVNNKLSIEPDLATNMLRQLLTVPTSHEPEVLLEIILLELNLSINRPAAAEPADARVKKSVPKEKTEEKSSNREKPAPTEKQVATEPVKPKTSPKDQEIISDTWPQVLDTIKKRHNTVYGVLRMAHPSYSNETLTLSFAFAFHQKKINEEKTRALIRDVFNELTGQNLTVNCVVQKDLKSVPPTSLESQKSSPANSNGEALETISNIFGGGEVLE